MAVEIILPKLGMDMQSGIIMTWYKNEGDTISKGEPLFELMTDKVNIEVEAEASGILLKKYYDTGVELPVFITIGYIGAAGEAIPEKESVENSVPKDTFSSEDRAALRSIRSGRHDGFSGGGNTVRATPAARRLALQNDIDLNNLKGSGPKGRIQVEDVEEAMQTPKNIKKTEIPQQKVFVVEDEPKVEEVIEFIDEDEKTTENPGMVDSLDMTLEELVAGMSSTEKNVNETETEKMEMEAQEAVVVEVEEKIEKVETETASHTAVLSPLAERMVEIEHVDIADIGTGSGPDGRIMKEDVLKAMESAAIKATAKRGQIAFISSDERIDEADHLDDIGVKEQSIMEIKDTEVVEEVFEEKQIEKAECSVEQKAELIKPVAKSEEVAQPVIEQPEVKEKAVEEKSESIQPENIQIEAVGAKRKIIAERMLKSNLENVVITLTTEIDMTEIKDLRKKISKKVESETGCRCTYTDFLLVSVSRALMEHPYINSTLQDDNIILHDYVNLGLAVGMDDGLIVPVINSTDNLSFSDMVVKRSELLKAVKNKKLTSDRFKGSTFTVTNLGMYGILEFSAIINQPNSAILSVGEVVERVRIFKGEPTPRSIMKISINLDHRVADGMAGAKFLQTVKGYMENPALLLF